MTVDIAACLRIVRRDRLATVYNGATSNSNEMPHFSGWVSDGSGCGARPRVLCTQIDGDGGGGLYSDVNQLLMNRFRSRVPNADAAFQLRPDGTVYLTQCQARGADKRFGKYSACGWAGAK